MSPSSIGSDENPHPKTLLQPLRGHIAPELYAMLERLCDRVELNEVTLQKVVETLEDHEIFL